MRSYDKALATVHHSHAGGTGRESLPIIKCQAATAGINDIHPISQCGLPQGLYGLQCPASVGIQVEFPALAHILPLVGGGSGETCYGLHHPPWLIVSEVVKGVPLPRGGVIDEMVGTGVCGDVIGLCGEQRGG